MKASALFGLFLFAACSGSGESGSSGTGGSTSTSTSGTGGSTSGTVLDTDGDGRAETHITTHDCSVSADALAAKLGVASKYTESTDATTRSISINGVPNHAVADFPITTADPPANIFGIKVLPMNLTAPLTPSGSESTVGQNKLVGVATSGAVFHYGAGAFWNNDFNSEWQYDLFQSDAFGMDLGVDCNGGHVFPVMAWAGQYHYHGTPTSMLPATPAMTLVGWAADGYPIFAKWGHVTPSDETSGVTELKASYRLKSGTRPSGPGGTYDGLFLADYEYVAGFGDLDKCNGRKGSHTVGGKTYDYAYYTSSRFPYLSPCLTATSDKSFEL